MCCFSFIFGGKDTKKLGYLGYLCPCYFAYSANYLFLTENNVVLVADSMEFAKKDLPLRAKLFLFFLKLSIYI